MASVIIIEDEHRIRELVARVLADQGYDVTSTTTAMEGLQSVVGGSPDLVILDMGLPDLDGTELLKMIRAVSTVPVIVATAPIFASVYSNLSAAIAENSSSCST